MSSVYNNYYHAIMNANSIYDEDVCRDTLRGIYARMCRETGLTNDEFDRLYRYFRLYI